MRNGSAKKKSQNFRIKSGASREAPKVDARQIDHTSQDGKLSVNLKYYQKSAECFSSWQKAELKAFSNWVDKTCTRTEAQVTSATKNCHAHNPGKRAAGFSVPQEVSPDVKFYGLDVTKGGRVHGFFERGQFFLVWLDRGHKVFK